MQFGLFKSRLTVSVVLALALLTSRAVVWGAQVGSKSTGEPIFDDANRLISAEIESGHFISVISKPKTENDHYKNKTFFLHDSLTQVERPLLVCGQDEFTLDRLKFSEHFQLFFLRSEKDGKFCADIFSLESAKPIKLSADVLSILPSDPTAPVEGPAEGSHEIDRRVGVDFTESGIIYHYESDAPPKTFKKIILPLKFIPDESSESKLSLALDLPKYSIRAVSGPEDNLGRPFSIITRNDPFITNDYFRANDKMLELFAQCKLVEDGHHALLTPWESCSEVVERTKGRLHQSSTVFTRMALGPFTGKTTMQRFDVEERPEISGITAKGSRPLGLKAYKVRWNGVMLPAGRKVDHIALTVKYCTQEGDSRPNVIAEYGAKHVEKTYVLPAKTQGKTVFYRGRIEKIEVQAVDSKGIAGPAINALSGENQQYPNWLIPSTDTTIVDSVENKAAKPGYYERSSWTDKTNWDLFVDAFATNKKKPSIFKRIFGKEAPALD
jgi:hypothetical protein